jgi:hypothetical protein
MAAITAAKRTAEQLDDSAIGAESSDASKRSYSSATNKRLNYATRFTED